jgi:hypothetical protein
MNEELPLESTLDLTLTQHPCDENPDPREVCRHLEVEPHMNLVLSHFFKLSHLGDFVANQPCYY